MNCKYCGSNRVYNGICLECNCSQEVTNSVPKIEEQPFSEMPYLQYFALFGWRSGDLRRTDEWDEPIQ